MTPAETGLNQPNPQTEHLKSPAPTGRMRWTGLVSSSSARQINEQLRGEMKTTSATWQQAIFLGGNKKLPAGS